MNRPMMLSRISPGAERLVAIYYLSPERFEAKPQIGIPIVQEWHGILRWLTWPVVGATKRDAGAWCPTQLVDGIVKGGRGPVSLLVADVDECEAGDLDANAAALANYEGAIIPTFSATPEKPKHRIVLLPDREMTEEEFPLIWEQMRRTFARSSIIVDKGCKNANRLYFGCVCRSLDSWMGARLLRGKPVDVDAVLAAARHAHEAEERARAERAALAKPVKAEHRGKYIGAACNRARANIAAAGEGGRHDALLRETYSLTRLGLTPDQITYELLDTFVAVAGEARRREGERAIRDAAAARQAKGDL